MSAIKSLAIYGVINGRLRVARGGGAGGVVGGAAPGSARVMGAFTGAPGVLREGGPALTQYGGGRTGKVTGTETGTRTRTGTRARTKTESTEDTEAGLRRMGGYL